MRELHGVRRVRRILRDAVFLAIYDFFVEVLDDCNPTSWRHWVPMNLTDGNTGRMTVHVGRHLRGQCGPT